MMRASTSTPYKKTLLERRLVKTNGGQLINLCTKSGSLMHLRIVLLRTVAAFFSHVAKIECDVQRGSPSPINARGVPCPIGAALYVYEYYRRLYCAVRLQLCCKSDKCLGF